MLDIKLDENQIRATLGLSVSEMKELDNEGQKLALKTAAHIANASRKYAYRKYFSKKYTGGDSPHLFLGRDPVRKDPKNRRLVNFSLKSVSYNWKRATLTAYPLNLYENDTKVYTKPNPWIRATYNTPITYKRTGTHIMRKLTPEVAKIADKNKEWFRKQLIKQAGDIGK